MQSKKHEKQNNRVNVIIYELNEVPWEIVDLYIKERPHSNLASLIVKSSCLTTVNEDPTPFQPWRTWPTFHKSMYSDEHNSFDLGQNPKTFYGENIWDVAEANGLRVGLFGVMQSWPPHQLKNGGFYIPDTFSPSPEAFPESMRRFQEFNLLMTKRNNFSSESNLNIWELLLVGMDFVKKGITPYTVYNIGLSLIKERIDARYKAGRSILQVLPGFDLYWKLHLKYQPNLSIFFTNHVAGMMHRYWGDGVPGYAEVFNHRVDKVFSTFICKAMDMFDHQLGRIMNFVSQNQNTVLIVASSMGQGPIPPVLDVQESYVVEDTKRLVSALNLGNAQEGLAMYPRTALIFSNEENAKTAIKQLQSVTSRSGLKFYDFNLYENSLTFAIKADSASPGLSRDVSYSSSLEEKSLTTLTTGKVEELGISIKTRPGGGNTAYHTPEGIFITYGSGIVPNPSRQKVSVLDAAPSILSLLDLPQPESLRGKPISLF
jgi:hypothetical protein